MHKNIRKENIFLINLLNKIIRVIFSRDWVCVNVCASVCAQVQVHVYILVCNCYMCVGLFVHVNVVVLDQLLVSTLIALYPNFEAASQTDVDT